MMSILVLIAFAGFISTIFLFKKGGVYAVPEAPVEPVVPFEPVIQPIMLTKPETLYQAAYACLETHQTLDPSVPKDVGCGEAWSSVAKQAGVTGIPPLGYASTHMLYLWLVSNPAFKVVSSPIPGDTIISPTGHGNGQITGHVGVVGKYHIMSNNSDTGLFSDHWTLSRWKSYYGGVGALPVIFFRWIG